MELPSIFFSRVGSPSFQVPATNPFNPFGQAVARGRSCFDAPRAQGRAKFNVDFYRPVVGGSGLHCRQRVGIGKRLRGIRRDKSDFTSTNLLLNAAASSLPPLNSSSASTAFNPFVADQRSQLGVMSSFAIPRPSFKGSRVKQPHSMPSYEATLFRSFPAGPLKTVFGAEYDRDELDNFSGLPCGESGLESNNFDTKIHAPFRRAAFMEGPACPC